jgi:hypothetical protein
VQLASFLNIFKTLLKPDTTASPGGEQAESAGKASRPQVKTATQSLREMRNLLDSKPEQTNALDPKTKDLLAGWKALLNAGLENTPHAGATIRSR